jgi:hypothetical protein
MEYLTKNRVNYSNNIIFGYEETKKYMETKLREKIIEFVPLIKNANKDIMRELNNEINKLGRESPNMREVAHDLKRYLDDEIKNMFSSVGQQFAIGTKDLKESVSSNIINNYNVLIPKVEELEKQLSCGSRRIVEGTEGWNEIVCENIKSMAHQTEKNTILPFVKNYINVIKNMIKNKLESPYNAFCKDVQISLLGKFQDELDKVENKKKEEFSTYLGTITTSIYKNDQTYVTNFNNSLIHNILSDAFKYIAQNKDICNNLEHNIKYNTNNLIRKVTEEIQPNQPSLYHLKSILAREQILDLWDALSKEIHDFCYRGMMNCDQNFEKYCIREIWEIKENDIVESENDRSNRNNLLEIERVINEINNSVKNIV